jgi:hypothetical protein
MLIGNYAIANQTDYLSNSMAQNKILKRTVIAS